MTVPETDTSGAALTTLRGAGVNIDIRRVRAIVVAVSLVTLAVVVVVLFLVGFHKNSQINRLRLHGVAVNVTVSRCLGIIGGSGSNPAGFACQGTFVLDGRRYTEAIPGDFPHRPGPKIRGVAVSGDPPLLSTAHAVATERASAGVYLVPAILLVILLVLVGAVVLRRRRGRCPPTLP